MSMVTEEQWKAFIAQKSDAHLLQTAEWAQQKAKFGWTPKYFIVDDRGALVLTKSVFMKYRMAYLPKGPVGKDWAPLWQEIDAYCKKNKVFLLKVEPDFWQEEVELIRSDMQRFREDASTVQPRCTIVLTLEGDEEDWLARMKQKTRYNIRLARKKDVHVVIDDRVDIFNQLMQKTGERDDFRIHKDTYYQQVYDLFSPKGECALLTAYYQDQPLASLMVFARGKRAWYLYGASNNKERNRMPAYLVQVEAMRWAKEQGCEEYDLWGIPDAPEAELESSFTERSDGLWGVYRFKRGFGGEIKRSVGAWDRIYKYPIYWLYLIYTRMKK